MAKSSIADVYVAVLPTVDGITNALKNELQAIGNLAANYLAQGLVEGAQQGANALQTALNTVAQNAHQDFSQIMSGVQIPVSTLQAQFGNLASQAGDAFQDSITQGLMQSVGSSQVNSQINSLVNDTGNAMSSAVTQGLAQGVGSSQVTSQINSLANDANNAMSSAVQQGVTQGVSAANVNVAQLSPVQNATQAAVAAGVAAGVTGANVPANSLAPVQNATQNATQGGAVSGFKKAGPAILGVIAALGIGAVVGSAISKGLEKEKGSAKMTASLGLSPAEAKKLGASTGALYAAGYGESMEEIQTATGAVVSSFAGMRDASSKDIEAVTKRALNMADAFEVDVVRASQVASQMITTGWAKDGVEAMDMLSASMQKVPANVREDIMDAVDEYGPFMKELGLEGERGMGLLVDGAKKGMYGIDKTGDALKEFTIRAKDMSTASEVGYKNMGLNQASYSKALMAGGKSGAKAFDDIVGGLLKIENPLKQQEAALALFGTPLEDLSVNEIPKFLKGLKGTASGLGDTAKAAKDMDKALSETTGGAITKFKRTIETVLTDAIFPLVKELQPMMEQVGQWFKDNQAAITDWIRVVVDGVKSVLIPVFTTVMPYLKTFATWFSENQEALKLWIPIIMKVAAVLIALSVVINIISAITGLIVAIKGISIAFWAATTASTAFGVSVGWLVLLIAGVLALGLLIGWALTKLWDFLGGWEGISQGIVKIFSTVIDHLVANWRAFTEWIGSSIDWIGQRWVDMWSRVGQFFQDFGRTIMNNIIGFVNIIINAVNWVVQQLNTLSFDVPDWVPGIGGNTFGFNVPMIANIPALATGADVMSDTIVRVGEKDPESVVNRGGVNKAIDNINAEFEKRGTGGGDTYYTVTIENTGKETAEELAIKLDTATTYLAKR